MIYEFAAAIEIVGINPFVSVPENILASIFQQCGKTKGPIPVQGTVNTKPYRQTLVKYKGAWRLYINTSMLKNSPKRIGETIRLTIAFDPEPRIITPHPKWVCALEANPAAKTVFDSLPPYRKTEIIRYIASLKNEESVDRNIERAIGFLLGQEKFAGRDKI